MTSWPYPEGTACAEVLRATTAGAGRQRLDLPAAWRSAAAVKILCRSSSCYRTAVAIAVPVLPKAEIALELAPALLAVGFILGTASRACSSPARCVSALRSRR
jgi:uncharacterized oligopeptide transporter (OPT) family protein